MLRIRKQVACCSGRGIYGRFLRSFRFQSSYQRTFQCICIL